MLGDVGDWRVIRKRSALPDGNVAARRPALVLTQSHQQATGATGIGWRGFLSLTRIYEMARAGFNGFRAKG
jgi:hypothetical protein